MGVLAWVVKPPEVPLCLHNRATPQFERGEKRRGCRSPPSLFVLTGNRSFGATQQCLCQFLGRWQHLSVFGYLKGE